ncbi:transcriptional regulator [Devosia sp. Root413D1]|uniref:helix-turn-helix domain-containing protein n=1 Tax=Devosia sp. Root413D1 TaxID=1736531 RepID=UPI0006FCC6E9|nr:AraC family transcriptional regulator [Devosia sp. Root413D1]KQW86003.1 transcriptional regulator [Devosia sp. Root413D1]
MKPLLEKVMPPDDASWAWLDRRLEDAIPFQWHHHPEFELTLTLNSVGQRFIGDHIGDYDDGDLVLIGPNLPHTWASRDKRNPAAPHVARVMWFHPNWAAGLTALLAELRGVAELLARAQRGLRFSDGAAAAVRPLIDELFARPAADRLSVLIDILRRLADDGDATPLASPIAAVPQHSADRTRIDRVLDVIHQRYMEPLAIGELADVAALSASGLHRMFVRHVRSPVSVYITRLRLGEACALLSATTRPIAHVASDVGYDSLANFNRQFKAMKQMTPRQYRQRFAAGRR